MAVDPDDTWRGAIGIVMIIIFLSILGGVAYMLYGPGFTIEVPSFYGKSATTTPEVIPTEETVSENFLASQPGQLFTCEAGKSLKAGFENANVRLALSDGRSVILSQNVDKNGEVQYVNADGSFAFLNTRNSVSVVENKVTTYKNCTAAE